jgi:hypothetical protein
MSRFERSLQPPEYAPVLTLSTRLENEGGGVRDTCAIKWAFPPSISQPELIVLIHGYNNHLQEAQEAYAAFRRGQEERLDVGDKGRLEAMLGDCFWPGDAKWPGPLDWVDFLVYPAAIQKGVDSAEVLGDYLLSRTDVLMLHFVGHSLGCRVVLETIKYMQAKVARHKTIGKVCLMAAAVPTFKVCPGGELYEALQAAQYLRVLYSPDDKVLSMAFPVGQSIAPGDEGFFPTAVGRYGDVPLSPGRITRDHVVGASHGDYWGVEQDAATEVAKEAIAEFLGIGPRFQTIAEQPLPAERPDVTRREVGHLRTVGGHA